MSIHSLTVLDCISGLTALVYSDIEVNKREINWLKKIAGYDEAIDSMCLEKDLIRPLRSLLDNSRISNNLFLF